MKKFLMWLGLITLNLIFCTNIYAVQVSVNKATLSEPDTWLGYLYLRILNTTDGSSTELEYPHEIDDGTYEINIHGAGSGTYGSFEVSNGFITNLTGSLVLGSEANSIDFDINQLTKVTTKFSDFDLGKDQIDFRLGHFFHLFRGDQTFYLPVGEHQITSYGAYISYGKLTIDDENISVDGYLKFDSEGNVVFDYDLLTKITIQRGDQIGQITSIPILNGATYLAEYTFHAVPDFEYEIMVRGNPGDIFGKIIINSDGTFSTTSLLKIVDEPNGVIEFDIERAPKLTFLFDQLSQPVEEVTPEYETVYSAVAGSMGSAYEKSALFPFDSEFTVLPPSNLSTYGDFTIDDQGNVTTTGFLTKESEFVDENGRVETIVGFQTCDMISVTITPLPGVRFWFHNHYSTYDATINYLPSGSYKIYSDGNKNLTFSISPDEGLTIAEDNGLLSLLELSFSIDQCQPIDIDIDGVIDEEDNCVETPNPDQLDQDMDGKGDACDDDIDGDDVLNESDNCEQHINPQQADSDGDGIGDACDDDADGDSVNDDVDNCLGLSNTDQFDNDEDLIGDACDTDDDNDTVSDEMDNCPFAPNVHQEDYDGDGEGDACDGDVDNDSVDNINDECPNTPLSIPIYTNGCSGIQYITLMCKKEDFSKHGHYVSCVAHAAKEALEFGLITNKERGRIVSQAAQNK